MILKDLGFDLFSVSYVLTDDVGIRRLNSNFRKINRSTDVLSFPLYKFYQGELLEPILVVEYPVLLGDIVISMETIVRRSKSNYRRFKDYLLRIVIHAILHLVGYDHIRLKERKVMREMEEGFFVKYKKVVGL